jgi:hypothetical protein
MAKTQAAAMPKKILCVRMITIPVAEGKLARAVGDGN